MALSPNSLEMGLKVIEEIKRGELFRGAFTGGSKGGRRGGINFRKEAFPAGNFPAAGVNVSLFVKGDETALKKTAASGIAEISDAYPEKPAFSVKTRVSATQQSAFEKTYLREFKPNLEFAGPQSPFYVKTSPLEFKSLSSDFAGELLAGFDFILFFLAAGAAVRLIAPHLKNKFSDPAVTAVDESGKFAVSLLSGHTGGANAFTEAVAKSIGATPVITTATDGAGLFSLDLFAKDFDLFIEDEGVKIKQFNSASLKGKKFSFYVDGSSFPKPARKSFISRLNKYLDGFSRGGTKPEVLKLNPRVSDSKNEDVISRPEYAGAKSKVSDSSASGNNSGSVKKIPDLQILITSKAFPSFFPVLSYRYSSLSHCPTPSIAVLRPRNIVLGLGCNRNTEFIEIEDFVLSIFQEYGLSVNSIRNVATIDLKKDEEGIMEFARKYALFSDFFSKEEINRVPSRGAGEDREKSLCFKYTGAYSVAEPCALLSANSGTLLIPKIKRGNVTMAASIF